MIEVLSDGTEEYDRGEKLEHYKKVPSLMAVVLVSHRERKIDVWTRHASAWELTVYGSGQVARISPLDCSLPVDAVYDAASEHAS